MLGEFLAAGHFVDLVLIFLVIEAVWVISHWRKTKRGVAPADFLPGMISGALMLIALRVTIGGGHFLVPTICLCLAGLAHLVDVARRWRS
jgi:hypothetical protein